MEPSRSSARLRATAAALCLYASAGHAQGLNISFPLTDFTTWTRFGTATASNVTPGNGFTFSNLVLTSSGTGDSAGAGFAPDPLLLDFNQAFTFSFNFFIPVPAPGGDTTRGDGFTFTLATSPGLGGGGSDLGYGGLSGRSIAFAIDTFSFDDEPTSPSLQILENGSNTPLAFTETGLGDAIRNAEFQWFATFSFAPSGQDDETGTLTGTISHLTLGDFSVSTTTDIDLSQLGESVLEGGHLVYFGFTAGNGAAIDGHIITSSQPVPLPAAGGLMLMALGGLLRVSRRG